MPHCASIEENRPRAALFSRCKRQSRPKSAITSAITYRRERNYFRCLLVAKWLPLAWMKRRTRRRSGRPADGARLKSLGAAKKNPRARACVPVQANWAYFMSRSVIYASFAAFSPRGNEMVITTLRFGDELRAAIITLLMWEIVAPRERDARLGHDQRSTVFRRPGMVSGRRNEHARRAPDGKLTPFGENVFRPKFLKLGIRSRKSDRINSNRMFSLKFIHENQMCS